MNINEMSGQEWMDADEEPGGDSNKPFVAWAKAILIAALLLAVMAGQAMAQGRNFSYTCMNIRLNGTILTADCRTKGGTYNYGATINLDVIIGNRNGNLEFENNSFSKTCTDISVTTMPHAALWATCRTYQGGLHRSILNLDNFIGNYDGWMRYGY